MLAGPEPAGVLLACQRVLAGVLIGKGLLKKCQYYICHYLKESRANVLRFGAAHELERNSATFCISLAGCLVQVGNGIELDTVGCQFEAYRWRPSGVTWDSVPDLSW